MSQPGEEAGGSIEIALAFDDAFWAPTYATMRSICLTTPHPERLRFHLLHRTLTPEHQAAIASIGHDYGARLDFIDIDARGILTDRIANFPRIKLRRLNPIVYARLFLGDLLDPDIARVLYLDSDIFVRTALDPLYGMDMQGHAIAAVLQPDRMHVIAGKDLRARNAFSMAQPYFNAGVMLIDMAQYRQMDFAAALARLPAAELALFYYDQDMINFCFRGRILEVDPRWNLQNAEPAHEVFNPAIVHYSANPKPWFAWSRVAFKRTYRHLMTNEYYYLYRRERMVRMVRTWLKLA
ncbi:glycosyltransferase family 8 protein [Devosia ginsengisoli]|uniref:glycosyltransferase family 8 protein n=1 Tax=Devosia ginsengisoli TaxID=400770 RepID=UPI0026EF5334|nr:glycosyltransferase family 8 protein [Devosia ginsengisoli]MCR6671073.1 glycosyltransferase family 8 protein [Devosia ginsengisoli]